MVHQHLSDGKVTASVVTALQASGACALPFSPSTRPAPGICRGDFQRQNALPISLNSAGRRRTLRSDSRDNRATAAELHDCSPWRHAPGWDADGARPPPPAGSARPLLCPRRHCMSRGGQESHYEVLDVPPDATDSAVKVRGTPSCFVSYSSVSYFVSYFNLLLWLDVGNSISHSPAAPSDQASDPVLVAGGRGLRVPPACTPACKAIPAALLPFFAAAECREASRRAWEAHCVVYC